GVLSGTDRDTTWARLLYGLAVSAVVAATAARLSRGRPLGPALVVGGALGAAAAALTVGLSAIPLPAAAGGAPSGQAPPRLSATFSGQIEERDGAGAVLVSVSGSAGSGKRTAIRIDLLQTRGDTETALQIRFPTGAGCLGTVAAIDRDGFAGSCTTSGGTERLVKARWSIVGREVHGTIDVTSPSPGADDGPTA
ncbi:MAG: hypothetical protein ACE5EV_09040, partial [Gaiellales bacterium]